jgi:hypothetical protein
MLARCTEYLLGTEGSGTGAAAGRPDSPWNPVCGGAPAYGLSSLGTGLGDRSSACALGHATVSVSSLATRAASSVVKSAYGSGRCWTWGRRVRSGDDGAGGGDRGDRRCRGSSAATAWAEARGRAAARGPDPGRRGTGLRYLPVEHAGNSTSSEEEGADPDRDRAVTGWSRERRGSRRAATSLTRGQERCSRSSLASTTASQVMVVLVSS